MKLIKSAIDRDLSGSVTLYPEEPEDMWHAYNLIMQGDHLTASAIRKLVTESSTGSVSATRVHTTLTICVEKIDFDPPSATLHLNGRVVRENKYVKMGQYHTLDLELNRNFTVTKNYDGWDSVAMQVVKDACDPAEKAEIGAVVMHEGLANICLVTEFMTVLRQRIDVSIPRKRRGDTTNAREKGTEKFYDAVYQAILRHLPVENLKVILLASPGFIAEGLKNYIMTTATRTSEAVVLKSRSKFVVTHCSSGHLHALNELLKSPALQTKISSTRFIKESRAMDAFYDMITADENRAWYGVKVVEKAVEKCAVQTLLVSNTLFRSQKIAERRRYVSMVDTVKEHGGEVLVLSSVHESGIRLDGLGGVAAILTFPLADLDDDDDDDNDSKEGAGVQEEEEGGKEKVGVGQG